MPFTHAGTSSGFDSPKMWPSSSAPDAGRAPDKLDRAAKPLQQGREPWRPPRRCDAYTRRQGVRLAVTSSGVVYQSASA
jgi:hypothetical protein